MQRADLADRLEANARLLTFSRPVIENLYQQIGSPSSTVLLADRDGLILSTIGCPDFLDRAAKVALSPGARWREADVGSNAIGTALHTGTFVAIRGDEHYLDRNRVLTCVATPILAPDGGILGILDISTDARADLSHANALLHTTAELIEHRLIEHLDDGFLGIHFHSRPELLGGPLEALVVFDDGGHLVASNRLARRLLSLDPQYPATQCEACFTTPWARLVGWAAMHQGRPFPLRTQHGRTFYARTHLRAPRTPPPAAAPGVQPDSLLRDMVQGDARVADVVARLQNFDFDLGSVLIEGETGAGKSHLTLALHKEHLRTHAAAALIVVDCSTITSDETGLAEALSALSKATGGTLVLRQIANLAPAHQAHLFAAGVQLPGTRLIATTTRPVATLMAAGQLASEAFATHGGRALHLPPLRERSDFAALVQHFVRELCVERHLYVCPDTITLLQRHRWPGNLSELRNRLKLILALMGDNAHQLCPEDIPDELFDDDDDGPAGN